MNRVKYAKFFLFGVIVAHVACAEVRSDFKEMLFVSITGVTDVKKVPTEGKRIGPWVANPKPGADEIYEFNFQSEASGREAGPVVGRVLIFRGDSEAEQGFSSLLQYLMLQPPPLSDLSVGDKAYAKGGQIWYNRGRFVVLLADRTSYSELRAPTLALAQELDKLLKTVDD